MARRIERIDVVTGDHSRPDPTKRGGRYNEEDFVTHQAMRDALEGIGDYEWRFWNEHGGLLDLWRREPPDLVVNFCDTGYRNIPTLELNLPAYLELLGVPYTGAPPAAMVICYDKAIVRHVAAEQGVPVPAEAWLPAGDLVDRLPDRFPGLIKPNAADGSVGITKDAVVRTREEAEAYLSWFEAALPGRDALYQEYLPGPEYGVGLIGNPDTGLTALPPLEVDFTGLPAGLAPILSYESKAIPDSPYWTEIKFREARLGPEERALLEGWARVLFRRLGLRDYGRFDFRVAADGTPRLMEVNPNPAWGNDGKLAVMASFAGISYRDMLKMIVDAAIARLG